MRFIFLPILKFLMRWLAELTLVRYEPGVVGITGSVGKTSTKSALNAVLGSDRRVRAAGKSFNNELGLPLTIVGDWQSTEGLFFWPKVLAAGIGQLLVKNSVFPHILVLEYGVDRPGDMDYLLRVARPQIGIVTALGEVPVHVEFFTGPGAVRKEKAKMVGALPVTGFAILNGDDKAVLKMKDETRAHPMTFGFSRGVEMRISGMQNHLDKKFKGVSFKLTYGGTSVPVKIKDAFGKTHAYAAAAASAAGLIYGMNLGRMAEALSDYEPPAGRLCLLPGIKETFIIDDTYNSSPTATEEALSVLGSLKAKRKIAVLGDMLELGKYTMSAHENVGRLIPKNADFLITVGSRGKFIAERAAKSKFSKKKIKTFMDVGEAGLELQRMLKKGDVALVKGSQAVRMEKIVKEVMAEPQKAEKLLVRQSPIWLRRKGLYG
jgi:UDP-N-acetylmuramoyl-tripeptide--D-alanyl-D-alanine ligase